MNVESCMGTDNPIFKTAFGLDRIDIVFFHHVSGFTLIISGTGGLRLGFDFQRSGLFSPNFLQTKNIFTANLFLNLNINEYTYEERIVK